MKSLRTYVEVLVVTLLSSCVCAVLTSPGQVTTGGVSMGDRDLLRQVLVEQFGARIHFARVNMKPGKPTTFATCTLAGRRVLLGTADTAGSIFFILSAA